MKRGMWIGGVGVIAGITAIGALAWWTWPAPGSDLASTPVPPAAAPAEPPPVASAPPAAAPVAPSEAPAVSAAAPAPLELPDAIPEEQRELIESDPVLRERARQQQLAAAADARWEQAVDQAGFSARDLDPTVRRLFGRMLLEPRYAEGGRIDGLVITELPADHPLARAGFRSGDRLTSIQGVPLRDPAELPSLLAHLGPRITFCADRSGSEQCQELVLE